MDRKELSKLVEQTEILIKKNTWQPADLNQEKIAKVWAEVLGFPPETGNENFFDAGGHSLLVIKMIGRLQDIFRKEIPLSLIFNSPTIASMTASIIEL